MERIVFRWLTGAGVVAALVTLAVDKRGFDWLPVGPEATEVTPPITVLIVERNGAKLIPYAVCTVAQVGE